MNDLMNDNDFLYTNSKVNVFNIGDIVFCAHPSATKDIFTVIGVREMGEIILQNGDIKFLALNTYYRLATKEEIKEAVIGIN